MKKHAADAPPAVPPHLGAMIDPEPHVVAANGIYTVGSATRAPGLSKSSLPREIRQGRLRVAKRAGRYFILGAWLLEWLQSGERRRDREEKAGIARGMPRIVTLP